MSLQQILDSTSYSQNYEKNSELAPHKQEALFENISDAFEQLKDNFLRCHEMKNLPTLTNRASHLTVVTDLYFLTLCAEDENKNIFPLEYAKIVAKSNLWNEVTAKGLKFAPLAIAFFTLFALSSFVSVDQKISTAEQVAIAVAIAIAGNFASAMVGFATTGTFPDKSSQYYNEKQNRTHLLQKRFDQMGYCLIDMFFADEQKQGLAIAIANKLELGGNSLLDPESHLYKIAVRQNLNFEEISTLFSVLDQATGYVRRGEIYRDVSLQKHIAHNFKCFSKRYGEIFIHPNAQENKEIHLQIDEMEFEKTASE